MQQLYINKDTTLKLPNGNVGICFSGGVDSTLLAFLAMSQLKSKIFLITMSTVDRGLAQHKTTADVIAKLCEITNNYNVEHVVACEPDAKNGIKNLFKLPKRLLYQDRIVNCILTGTNTDPPSEVTDTFKYTDRSAEMIAERLPGVSKPTQLAPGWYCPITNLNKQDICKIYHEQGILDSLLPVTKSCGTDYGESDCNECWFCEERKWGLDFRPH